MLFSFDGRKILFRSTTEIENIKLSDAMTKAEHTAGGVLIPWQYDKTMQHMIQNMLSSF